MATSSLSKLLTELGLARQRAAEAYKLYKQLKEQEDGLRAALFEELHLIGLDSAKGSDFTASIRKEPTFIIQHEPSVIQWLRETPDVEEDAYIGLDKTKFKTLAKTILKQTGEIIPGSEYLISESLAIRANKKG
jgi:hypothetical protein